MRYMYSVSSAKEFQSRWVEYIYLKFQTNSAESRQKIRPRESFNEDTASNNDAKQKIVNMVYVD